MKTINVTFEDDEHEKLVKSKAGQSWRNYILFLQNEVTAIYKDRQNAEQIIKDAVKEDCTE